MYSRFLGISTAKSNRFHFILRSDRRDGRRFKPPYRIYNGSVPLWTCDFVKVLLDRFLIFILSTSVI